MSWPAARGRAFAAWFATLLLFFALANLAGVVRPMGLFPYRETGFPLTFAVWGFGVEQFFDWRLLAVNGLIAGVTAGLLAGLLARLRSRRVAGK